MIGFSRGGLLTLEAAIEERSTIEVAVLMAFTAAGKSAESKVYPDDSMQ